ncbi:methyltransferase [Candidatus Woesearchaeota archaeon]|nr:methyltransferase [Candidatus Woesearchaeota archaeon]
MKGIVITSKGIEETAAIEVKELINAECVVQESCVIFDFKEFRDLCLLCYKCQSADRVLQLIASFEFGNFFEGLEKAIEKSDLGIWLKEHKKFRVECVRLGAHDFKSVDVEAKAGKFILKKHSNKKFEIDIKGYKVAFLIFIIGNKCYFGVDFAGFELNKRAYKIFLHPNSLRGTIAYALVRESGFKKGDAVLDPFSRDGVIAIEAAFYASGFPHNYYKKDKFAFLRLNLGIDFEEFFKSIDNKVKKPKAGIQSYDHLFKYVDYSKKNAKIAGVEKFINFSRVELEWLDIKFREKSVDRIITNPVASKSANLDKVYNEFFYQSAYILKDEGRISIISRMPDFVRKHAEKHDFAVVKEKEVWSGEQMLKIIVFKKEISF